MIPHPLKAYVSLGLLIGVDDGFSGGMVDRADMLASMAVSLCETAGIIVDGHLNHELDLSDQLHGCYWSLYLMEKMHNCGRAGLQFPTSNKPRYQFLSLIHI